MRFAILIHSTGQQFTDTVSLGPGLTITRQSIGAAIDSVGFQGVDGILGYEMFISCDVVNH